MVINPESQSASFVPGDLGVDREAVFKYSDICLGPDDKLYCSPFGAPTVLVFDSRNSSFSTIGRIIPGDSQYSSICQGPDRKLYCSPENAPYVMVITPDSCSLEFLMGNTLEKDAKMFLGICAGPTLKDGDGRESCKLYCAPFNNARVMEIEARPVCDIAEERGGATLRDYFVEEEERRMTEIDANALKHFSPPGR